MTSQNFAAKSGSFDTLNCRMRWGLIPLWFQIFLTVLCETPAAAAIVRVLCRVQPFGGCVAPVTTRSRTESGNSGLRPRPGLSESPWTP